MVDANVFFFEKWMDKNTCDPVTLVFLSNLFHTFVQTSFFIIEFLWVLFLKRNSTDTSCPIDYDENDMKSKEDQILGEVGTYTHVIDT